MFSTILTEVKGLLGRAFLFSAFLPTLIFFLGCFAVYEGTAGGVLKALMNWTKLPAATQAVGLVASLIALALVAVLLSGLQPILLSLYEGYWPSLPVVTGLRRSLVSYYRSRRDWLEAEAEAAGSDDEQLLIDDTLKRYFVPPTRVNRTMPTCLGNVLRAAELYAFERYGFDAVILWPRLSPLLPQEVATRLEDYRMILDAMVLLSFLSGTFVLLWCPLLCSRHGDPTLFLMAAAGWPLAYLFYRGAVNAALAYGEQIRAVFDLHRRRLLEAAGRVAGSPEEERGEFRRLAAFYSANVPLPQPAPPPKLSLLEMLWTWWSTR